MNESGIRRISDTDGSGRLCAGERRQRHGGRHDRRATDADGTDTVSYSLDDDAGGRFAIDATTGVVTVAGAIDREAAGSLQHHGPSHQQRHDDHHARRFTITINDVDEFDVGTVSDTNATANTVDENAANGTTVGITAAASDADATTNTIMYSLDDNAGGRFAIDASRAWSRWHGAAGSRNGGALATSRSAPPRPTARPPTACSPSRSTTWTSSTSARSPTPTPRPTRSTRTPRNGTAVGITAAASDADATTNTITYTLDDNAGGRFAIDANTGVVTVAGAIDREAAASHNITVRATSTDGSFTDQMLHDHHQRRR